MKHLRVITWARWKVKDAYDERFWTVFTASVLKPSFEYPMVALTMSVVNAAGRVLSRFASLAQLESVYVIPEEYQERLKEAESQAIREANLIREKQKALHRMSDLAPGASVVRTDTGEVIAEAERILKEGS